MSLNNQKQRNYLYSQIFMKWDIERRINTLQGVLIETSLTVHNFQEAQTMESYDKTLQAMADLETMQEVFELTYVHARPKIDLLKKEKLMKIKKTNKLTKDDNSHIEKQNKRLEEINKPNRLPKWKKYWIFSFFTGIIK